MDWDVQVGKPLGGAAADRAGNDQPSDGFVRFIPP
jgi:hypothetical protein